jgi:2-polyprenyl-6-hydroxyphenyl methylase/3-demethylubiquinone-9 3-methyltransferase
MHFDFGRNWRDFLDHTDLDAGVRAMEQSLRDFLGEEHVRGANFLDIGCGTGLASLAAMRLGAATVTSIDVSEASVRCAEEVRARFGYAPERWHVRRGSVLDRAFVETLPLSDVVYAWGVLHHTGNMALAFEHTCSRVIVGGIFHTAIYNRTWASPAWAVVKRVYNGRGPFGRFVLHGSFFFWNALARAVGFKHPFKRERGMSVWYDAIDWLGGYPYEYASHDEVVAMVNRYGRYTLVKSRRDAGFGCNEFVFRREG